MKKNTEIEENKSIQNPTFGTDNFNKLKINKLHLIFKKSDKSRTKMMNVKPFREAKLYDANGDLSKEWFFYFSIADENGVMKRIKERFDINRIKGKSKAETVRLRKQHAQDIIPQINLWLQNGANGRFSMDAQGMNVREAFERILAIKKSETDKERTRQSYSSVINQFIEWCADNQLTGLDIDDLNFHHLNGYVEYLLQDRKVSRRTVNNQMGYLRAFFYAMKEREWIDDIPTRKFNELKVINQVRNIPFNEKELLSIQQNLPVMHPRLFLAMCFIWYSYIRRSEIAQIKREHIDFKNKVLRVHGTFTKNSRNYTLAIVPEFLEILKTFEVDKLANDQYLFSKKTTLEAGLVPIIPNRISECWKAIVKDKIGVHKDMYAAKHTSGMLFVMNGGSIESLQAQMRHSNISETENYIKSLVPVEMSRKFVEQFRKGLLIH